jgi:hypothetical protein
MPFDTSVTDTTTKELHFEMYMSSQKDCIDWGLNLFYFVKTTKNYVTNMVDIISYVQNCFINAVCEISYR